MWEINNPYHRLYPIKYYYNSESENLDYYDAIELYPDFNKLKHDSIYLGLNAVALAFLTDTDFIALGRTYPKDNDNYNVVPLYTVNYGWIKDYVRFDNSPLISTNYYQRNLSVSSSPSAHILVTGQATGGGINVYKYHPETKTLEKIWVAD